MLRRDPIGAMAPHRLMCEGHDLPENAEYSIAPGGPSRGKGSHVDVGDPVVHDRRSHPPSSNVMDTQLARATVSIREMILRGRLKPGQRVAEATLADLLNMSRTPVRQALPVLAKEGLLIESGTRGYVVRTFTQSEILDAIRATLSRRSHSRQSVS